MAKEKRKRLLLIDGHALLHRAFHAMPDLTTSKGERVEAIYGFIRMLLKVVEDLKPSHLVVTFDRPVPTFRHKLYEGYQAKRPPMEETLKKQQERLREVIEAMEIPIYELDRYEADDLLGTLAKQAVKRGGEVVIVTGDRDILQLVQGDKIKVWTPKRGLSTPVIWDEAKFVNEYGFKPEKLVDYKGLVGDSSDNYPGVVGIGEKMAKKLLSRYPSLEEIYRHRDELDKRVKQKLIQGEKDAILSKDLARIRTDAPVELSWEAAELGDFRSDKLISLFEKLEFGSLLKKILEFVPKETVSKPEESSTQMELL